MNRGETGSNVLKPHNPKSSVYLKKQFFEAKAAAASSVSNGVIGKENIPQVIKNMPGVVEQGPGVKLKLPMSPLDGAGKVKKYLDNQCDRQPRCRGLQAAETTTTRVSNAVGAQKKRSNSSSDAVGNGAKTFVRTRFRVYDEATENDETTGRLMNVKLAETALTAQKVLPARGILKDNTVIVQKAKEAAKLPAAKPKKVAVSPQNLPKIGARNVCNIKQAHKKHLPRKSAKATYDALSLELAYNIEYMQEYVMFQREMNDKKKLSTNFLTRHISADQRRLVVKYLIGVSTYFKHPSFTLYQSVKIFDAYIDAVDVTVKELQMVSLASLWIALKKDLVVDEIPDAATIISLAGPSQSESKKPLIDCEQRMLMALKFEISFPDPFSLLALFTVMIDEVRDLKSAKVQELYYFGSYLIDVSLLNEEICNIAAIHLASICAEIALALTMPRDEHSYSPKWVFWRYRVYSSNPPIERQRLPDTELNDLKFQLLKTVVLSKDKSSDFYVVYKKYNTKRYGPISETFVSTVLELC